MSKIKLSKAKLRTIIVTSVSLVIALALIITDFFVPVKYLFSYMVIADGGAAEGVMRVRFADVGYGDCAIVELPDGKNMLIDGGDGRTVNTAKILKHLNKCGISEIDYLVCSSVNAGCCGGLAELISLKKVKKIYMPYCNAYINDGYSNFASAARASGAEIRISAYGAYEAGDNYFFAFLSPSPTDNPEGEYAALNANPSQTAKDNASAVIWLEYAGTCFLFTGDVRESAAERICAEYELLGENYPVNSGRRVRLEDCDVLKVANHGSPNSLCGRLYDLTKPEAAVISVGENGYGCPSAEAISSVANFTGGNLFRTDINGTITVDVTVNGYTVTKEKQ